MSGLLQKAAVYSLELKKYSRKMDPKAVTLEDNGPGKNLKTRIKIIGEEMIEKKVSSNGNTGRVYLPVKWVAKRVKIIRID